jgi:hypothetical protein
MNIWLKNISVAYFKRYRSFFGRTEENDEKSQLGKLVVRFKSYKC